MAHQNDDVSVLFSGNQLNQYDRRVFAACVDHFRTDRPLTPQGIEVSIGQSFFDLAHCMGLAYTRNTHTAIRSSLVRLGAAALRVRTAFFDLHLPLLLDVSLDEA